jgi:kynurenine formamidase
VEISPETRRQLELALRVFDLSMPLDPKSGDPLPPEIDYRDHREGIGHLARLLEVDESQVPDGLGSATEIVRARTHNGTHMDSPWHFFPTSEGRPARTIDQIPIEWCIGPGVILDCTEIAPGEEIPISHLEAKLAEIGHDLKPGHIVFIRTDASRHYYEPDYARIHPGMSREGTLWLIERGVRVMGIDAWAWDIPLPLQGRNFRAAGARDTSLLWAAHRVGKEHEYVHLEQLGGLDSVPAPTGFTACVFPIKVAGGSAGWVRAVAIFPDDEDEPWGS